ncbi:cobalt ECF transporter T component CbiQ [Rhodococcus pyridinivorans]|uniref:cobalt ECF transporter T component CbiQ n=1 Tax=Rhodococcus pyridinivorans TaxID=103816 RepID=UPI000586874F|nr:cobalt ECF transporter T component CbiQ [Rhodococcus pyridinivorans]MCD2143076.1 cobalt ECF transporter T component CbiQ [Rhodococcus pyridinivorans]
MSSSAARIDTVAWRSPWRQKTVAEKAVLYGGVTTLAVALPPWPTIPLLLALCLATTRPAGIRLGHVLRCARGPSAFILIAAVSTMFTVDLNNWHLSVSEEGIVQAAALGARAMTASIAMLMFASTTPLTTVMASLRRLGVPGPCIDVVTVMYRLVFVLLESVSVIRQAQTSRLGYSTPRRTFNSAGLLTAAVLTRAWTQARRLEMGLAGRDFGISMPTLDTAAVNWRFIGACVVTFSAIAGASLLEGTLL